MSYEPVTIREAAQLEVLLFVGLAFVGGLAIVYWGFQTYRFGRIIENTPTEPASSVAMGRTQLEGEVVPDETVYDQPFTEGQCVYGEFKVREYKEDHSDDDNDKSWQTIQQESFKTRFYIDDGTGRLLVDPGEEALYEISDAHSDRIEVDGSDVPPEAVRDFLGMRESAVERDSGLNIGKQLSGVISSITGGGADTDGDEASEETAEEPADESVDSDGVSQYAAETDFEHVTRRQLASVSSTGRPRRYIQTVFPIGEGGYVYGGATRVDPTADDLEDDVVIRTDPGTDELIVSDQGEFELAAGYTKRSIGYIAAGVIASAVLLALLAQILVVGPLYGIDAALP